MTRTWPADSATTIGPSVGDDDALMRKLTVRIVPLLFVCYVVSFLDRINIGFAQLQIRHDLAFTDAMYGLGASAFYVGYVLCGTPSIALLRRIGARRMFSSIMALCGVTSASMAFVATPAAYYALRFLLGVFEAGLFPGIVLYITYWFPAHRRAGVLSVFIAGVAAAGVLGGLFSGWIMRDMDGVFGMSGWRWMFAFEGLPALGLGWFASRWLTDSPEHARWLSAADQARLNALLERSARATPAASKNGSVVSNPQVYVFAFVYFAVTCASMTINFWLPLFIRDFGVHDVATISLLSAIPNTVGIVGLFVIARHSDRRDERVGHFVCCTIGAALALGALTLHIDNLPLMLGCLSLACALIYAAIPIFWAVPSARLPPRQVATGIAVISSVGVTSGIVVPWGIGVVRTITGTFDAAVYAIAVMLVLSGVALFLGVRATEKVRSSSSV